MEENNKYILNNDGYNNESSYDDYSVSAAELEQMKAARRERYLNQKPKRTNNPKIGKKTILTIFICAMLYYVIVFVLNLAGIIKFWPMFFMIVPLTVAILIAYWVYKKKNTSDDDDFAPRA